MSSDLPPDVVIRVTDLSKRYRRQSHGRSRKNLRDELVAMLTTNPWSRNDPSSFYYALNAVAFDVRQGERVAIIGPNGAGKSTLLKLLCRITLPSEGSVALRGRVTSILEVGTGFHPELSGRENLYLNGAILGLTKDDINERFQEILAFSGIGTSIDEPVKHYSSGMYVRLAFSIAAHLDPDILIIDEVLAVGDVEFREKCIARMNTLTKDARRTLILVSHDMEAIRLVCSRALLVADSRLLFDGPVEQAIRRYEGLSQERLART